MSLLPYIFALILVVNPAAGENNKGQKYVVLLAGANTYVNYYAQANTCHAYHTIRNGGIPASNIIHLNYDDAAHDPDNPFPNNLVNTPEGPNVYPGCLIDYRGKDVIPEVFMNVLTGNKSAIRELTGQEGKVLESGPNDHVFIAMSDHGAPGVFYFPNFTTELHAKELQDTLHTMHEKRMYKKMLIYDDSCYSGSMFQGLLPDNMNIYAASATNDHEPGYKCCWDSKRHIYVGSYLFNAFTYGTDKADRDTLTLRQLFEEEVAYCQKFKNATSHPQQYGDLSINRMVLSEFMGHAEGNDGHLMRLIKKETDQVQRLTSEDNDAKEMSDFLKSPPVDMGRVATIMRRLMSRDLTDVQRFELKEELDTSMKVKEFSEDLFKGIAEIAAGRESNLSPEFFLDNREPEENYLCYKQALNLMKSECPAIELRKFPFIARNFHVLINICNNLGTETVTDAIKRATFVRTECQRI